MKRFHVHVSVSDLSQSIRFYSHLFGSEPAVHKSDYAKWMLDDPRINFAISTHRQGVGVNHLGFQVDTDEELRELQTQLQAADAKMIRRMSSRAATPDPTSIGSLIPPASHGKRSTRWVRFPSMARLRRSSIMAPRRFQCRQRP
jgi:predicted enzyme related to lactoylglutathione lyase